jgi:hypothetical protein
VHRGLTGTIKLSSNRAFNKWQISFQPDRASFHLLCFPCQIRNDESYVFPERMKLEVDSSPISRDHELRYILLIQTWEEPPYTFPTNDDRSERKCRGELLMTLVLKCLNTERSLVTIVTFSARQSG